MIFANDEDRRVLRLIFAGKKYNFIGRHNDLLCNTWFDFAKEFNCGIALVGFKEDNFDYPNYRRLVKPIQDEYNIDKAIYNKIPVGFYSNPFSK